MTDDDADDTQDKAVPESAKPWHDKIKGYREQIEDKWKTQRDNLDKLYAKERADSADREYSIFWANIEVLKAAVYARSPIPVVVPRFKQANPMASAASEVLERSLVTTFDQSDVDGCVREARDEYLRYSRGTTWVRLAAVGNIPRVEFDHVTACDFAHDPARTWREVKWVAKRVWVSLEDGRQRFDEPLARYGKKFDDVPLKKRDENSAISSKDDQAPVWEIWDRQSHRVFWVNEETDCFLDQREPWLDLQSFWPCPKPAYGTLVPGKLRPVPDIRQYKDQIEEINEYTARIAALSEQLRLKGFFPAGAGELGDAIETALKSIDNRATLVPVSSWAGLGGASPKDTVVWLPVDQVILVIKGLVELRRVVIDDVYQITGISDIVRGQSEASETATAQQLKSQWGSVRIRNSQNELARLARDMTRIAGEIIAENFDAQTLLQMAQMQIGPQEFAQIVQFLQDDKARGFTIEIETDSTIQPDEDADKQRRIEFVTAIGNLLNQALPAVQAAPQLGPFVGEVMKFVAQGFRAGRPLEGAIEQVTQSLSQMAQQANQSQGQPDPEAQARQQEAQARLEGTQAQAKAKVIGAQASIAKTNAETQAAQAQHAMTLREMEMQHVLNQQKMAQQTQAAQQPPRRMN